MRLNGGHHLGRDGVARLCGIDAGKALRRRSAALRVAGLHAGEESFVLALETIGYARRGAAFGGDGGCDFKPQRQVGLAALLNPGLELGQHGAIEAAATALVGEGGVGETVANDGAAGSQGRLNGLLQMIAPRGEDEQGFRQRVHRFVQHQFAQALG